MSRLGRYKIWSGRRIVLALGLALALLAAPEPVRADQPANCTDQQQYDITPPQAGQGLFSIIVTQVQTTLNTVSQNMYGDVSSGTGIVGNSDFRATVAALVTLYVAIYGILFTFGMIESPVHDFITRMIKVGIVGLLLTPGSWAFFSQYVVGLFNGGTDDIINNVISQVSPGGVTTDSGAPFSSLDTAIAYAVSAKMFITLMATFMTGPYGPIIGIIFLMSLGSFLKAMMSAMWIYIMSLVLKSLLFGLAPIFLSFLLFQRTRHLFDGWLNMIINASLQPILMFVFLGFFVALITACLANMTSVPACWVQMQNVFQGAPVGADMWRFDIKDPNSGAFQPGNVAWGWQGAPNGQLFPFDVILPFILWLLSDMMGRFIDVVVAIAQDLSSAATDLRMGSQEIAEWITGGAQQAGGAAASGAKSGGGMMGDIGKALGRAGGSRGGTGGGGAPPSGGGQPSGGGNPFTPGASGGNRG